ncbi:MAG TPA: hypothetical protein VKE41_00560 [Roseiflexaceae bacterium]|nr:hypothetical protein [Roseiflexaceae bacterium]
MQTVAPGLLLQKGAQPRQIGEPAPLAGARILQRGPPDWMAVFAVDLPQAQQISDVPLMLTSRHF